MIKKFNKMVATVMKDCAINEKLLQLNGSFNNSYWASDIDLYEPVDSLKAVLSKCEYLYDRYDILEIKVFLKTISKKYKRPPKTLRHTAKMVKIDILLTKQFPYPIECSIIYDFDPNSTYDKTKVVQDMVHDLEKKKYSLFKKVKRLNSIANISGYKNLFKTFLDNTKMGLLNLSIERIETLKAGKKYLSESETDKYMQWIQEDLRKIGINIKSDLRKELDAIVDENLKLLSKELI